LQGDAYGSHAEKEGVWAGEKIVFLRAAKIAFLKKA
jgi:hypothetical protein